MSKVGRRDFLRVSSAMGLGVGLGAGCATMSATGGAGRPKLRGQTPPGRATANEKITLGFVGIAGRGTHLLKDRFMRHADVEVAAVCDVYGPHRDAAVAITGGKAKAYRDFRDLLERDDIDAIVCATPPHWHPLVTIMACEAGKDVYCEKPMCFTPAEGQAMVKAARANHRITQVGTQIHATENYHHVVEIVRSGILGKISKVHCVLSLNEAPKGIGKQANAAPPKDLDWDMWCGPAPLLPYNESIFNAGHHRYVKQLIGSWIHEMGPHIVDLPVWAMGRPQPKSVVAMGGKYATDDISTIPDTFGVLWDYGDFMMEWTNMCASSHGLQFHGGKGITRRLGTSFHGTNATLLADYSTMEIVAEGERLGGSDIPARRKRNWPDHDREFLNCIKTRELPSCDVENHYNLHVALNLGNIAFNTGRMLTWDSAAGTIAGDAETQALAMPDYRAPWQLPA